MKKYELRKFSRDGLPIDAKDWTAADWQDLHEAIERVKKRVAKRHKIGENLSGKIDTRQSGGVQ